MIALYLPLSLLLVEYGEEALVSAALGVEGTTLNPLPEDAILLILFDFLFKGTDSERDMFF